MPAWKGVGVGLTSMLCRGSVVAFANSRSRRGEGCIDVCECGSRRQVRRGMPQTMDVEVHQPPKLSPARLRGERMKRSSRRKNDGWRRTAVEGET